MPSIYENKIAEKNKIPKEYIKIYTKVVNFIEKYNCEFIEKIHNDNKDNLKFPLSTNLIEDFLSGYEFEYLDLKSLIDDPFFPHFCNPSNVNTSNPYFEGCWIFDDEKTFIIYYNKNCIEYRQLFTKVHELMHVCQFVDPFFKTELEEISEKNILPKELIYKLVESTANKATAEYLMPREYFKDKFKELKNVNELASYFGVSVQSVNIRIDNLKLN